MLGVAPHVASKDPAIVRRRSRGSLPRLHLSKSIVAPSAPDAAPPGGLSAAARLKPNARP
jgi:hypothetical protein